MNALIALNETEIKKLQKTIDRIIYRYRYRAQADAEDVLSEVLDFVYTCTYYDPSKSLSTFLYSKIKNIVLRGSKTKFKKVSSDSADTEAFLFNKSIEAYQSQLKDKNYVREFYEFCSKLYIQISIPTLVESIHRRAGPLYVLFRSFIIMMGDKM